MYTNIIKEAHEDKNRRYTIIKPMGQSSLYKYDSTKKTQKYQKSFWYFEKSVVK